MSSNWSISSLDRVGKMWEQQLTHCLGVGHNFWKEGEFGWNPHIHVIHLIFTPELFLYAWKQSWSSSYLEADLLYGRAQEKAATVCLSKGKQWTVRKNSRWLAWTLDFAASTSVLLNKASLISGSSCWLCDKARRERERENTVANSSSATST